jgi:integrase
VWVRGTLDAMTLAAKSVNFGHLPINASRRSHIETWIKKMNADGLAPSTIKTRYDNVRTTFRAAKSDKIIGSVPTEGITLPRERRAAAAMRIPTPQEVAGLRQGEAAAVKLDDIDFLRRQLKVTRRMQRIPGGAIEARAEIRAPKFNSERIVFLPEGLLTMLSEHVRTVGVRGVAICRSFRPTTEDHRPALVA